MPEKALELRLLLVVITNGQRRETSMPTEPGHHFTVSDIESFEGQAGRILEFLPGAKLVRTQETIQIEYRGEEGIVVIVTSEGLELRHPTIEWAQGSHRPVPSSGWGNGSPGASSRRRTYPGCSDRHRRPASGSSTSAGTVENDFHQSKGSARTSVMAVERGTKEWCSNG